MKQVEFIASFNFMTVKTYNALDQILHLSLQLLVKGLQTLHVRRFRRPADTKTFRLVGLRDLIPLVLGGGDKLDHN